MNTEDTHPDLEPVPTPPMAVAVAEPGTVTLAAHTDSMPVERRVDAAQARVEAVAGVLGSAYANASQLKLTPEEAKALSEDFPDEAFSLGAGGDPNLVYIEHAYLRQRLNQVLGVGAAVPIRRREWAEEFKYWSSGKQVEGIRVYADLCLVVRGCLVGEAVGAGVYYKNNAKATYDDALESAMSNALRRCCKHFGVGLQAWMKGWCDGWKRRQIEKAKAAVPKPAPRPTPASASAPAPKPAPKPATPAEDGEHKRLRWINLCREAGGGADWYAEELYEESGNVETPFKLDDMPLNLVPKTKKEADALLAAIRERSGVVIEPPPENVVNIPEQPEPSNVGEELRGYIKHITQRPTKKGGNNYGILITDSPDQREGGEWVSTFDDNDGALAESLKGQFVTLRYVTKGQYKNLVDHSIEEAGDITP